MTQRNDETIRLVTVGQSEVDEMLEFYDSGMSDRTTQNAVALALRKILKEDIQLKVFHNAAHHSCECQIGEEEFSLPQSLVRWLDLAEHIPNIAPISFPVLLPKNLLIERSSGEPSRRLNKPTEKPKNS